MESHPLRAFLVDDHPAVRQILSQLLELNGFAVCAESDCARAAMQSISSLEVDLAVVDLSFEQNEGFELIAALRARRILVVVYSMHNDCVHISRSMACGANAYISKREDSEILLHGIREAIQGRTYLCPRARKAMEEQSAEVTSLPRCSEREVQILQLLGRGMGNNEIAETLALSVRTIETYCGRINEKLQLSGMKELRQFAIRHFHPQE